MNSPLVESPPLCTNCPLHCKEKKYVLDIRDRYETQEDCSIAVESIMVNDLMPLLN